MRQGKCGELLAWLCRMVSAFSRNLWTKLQTRLNNWNCHALFISRLIYNCYECDGKKNVKLLLMTKMHFHSVFLSLATSFQANHTVNSSSHSCNLNNCNFLLFGFLLKIWRDSFYRDTASDINENWKVIFETFLH